LKNIIISAIGSDRPGIVSELSGVITSHGCNVEESRMSRLGSDFAIIMLVTVSTDWEESLEVALKSITELTIITKPTSLSQVGVGRQFRIDLSGADNEGIVKVLSKYLAEKSINILEMETHTSQAPVSGTPLFNLNAFVSIPNDIEEKLIQSDLSQIAQKLGVEIQLNS
jgi:glycine cleavage system transcriptional repressor